MVDPVYDADGETIIGGKEIEQIVYYQSGVGTDSGEYIRGGMAGFGVAQNVRAAYAFLAHNYISGDEIYFFGFSRGAFTARLIAGLVTSLGVLTKRGMDSFPKVYEEYRELLNQKNPGEKEIPSLAGLRRNDEIHESARDAVQIVGVFDTVAFYAEGRLLSWLKGEQYDLKDIRLSHRVKYGYHALALDEERRPFRPTLWKKPKLEDLPDQEKAKYRLEEMRQVWFSGCHSDIGGGLSDPRLSDITLAWMISRCSGDDKLAFIDVPPFIPVADGQGKRAEGHGYYLLDPSKQTPAAATQPWTPSEGLNMQSWTGFMDMFVCAVENLRHGPRPPPKSLATSSHEDTEEYIHRSIVSRNMQGPALPWMKRLGRYLRSMLPWGHDVAHGYGQWAWPCKLLQGSSSEVAVQGVAGKKRREWPIGEGSNQRIWEAAGPEDVKADRIEDMFRGRIRKLPLDEALI